MNNTKMKVVGFVILPLLILLLVANCTRTYDPVDGDHAALSSSCVNCHTDKEMLIATADPDTSSSGGEAGEG